MRQFYLKVNPAGDQPIKPQKGVGKLSKGMYFKRYKLTDWKTLVFTMTEKKTDAGLLDEDDLVLKVLDEYFHDYELIEVTK